VMLVGILRRDYWREMRRRNELTAKMAHFQNPFLIINPVAGNGRAVKAHIDELAKKQGIMVIFTRKGDDLESVARRAVRKGADVLGVSGGDGSLGAVAKVAIEQHLPVVVLPGGTRCHFARDLGLAPKRITDALEGFHGVERVVDVADIDGRIFLNNASFGLYADIVDSPGYREHKVQASRNVLRSLVNGRKDVYDLHFRRGKLRVCKAVQVLVGVNSYETFNVFELGHRERLDGGVLQITAITRLNDETMRKLLSTMGIDRLEKNDTYSDIFQWTSKSFSITNSTGRIVAGIDGEREEYVTPVTIRIKPLALRIFVPAEGLRNRPKNPFSMFVVRRIWAIVIPTPKT
jgi:diacylglycerol kinase family enzyme